MISLGWGRGVGGTGPTHPRALKAEPQDNRRTASVALTGICIKIRLVCANGSGPGSRCSVVWSAGPYGFRG
eukprot:114567-Prymnesium_polylepis.1